MTDLHCRMGVHCATRDHATATAGLAIAHDLCIPCELHGRAAIARLYTDWADLQTVDHLGKDAGRQGLTGLPTTARNEAPIPLRADIDELARRISWNLAVWEQAVRDAARLSAVGEDSHTGEAVARAALTLNVHYLALLSLGPTDYIDYDTLEPTTLDGPGAVVALAGIHHQARAVLGLGSRRERRDLPCPVIPCERHGTRICRHKMCRDIVTGCGLYTLGWDIGGDDIDCRNCGWSCTLAEYAQYALTFIPPPRRKLVTP